MSDSSPTSARVSVDGKFFRLGNAKFYPQGVAYGPFPPDFTGHWFGTSEQATRDLAQVRSLGANALHVYAVPPQWFLDLAWANELRLLIEVPWNQQGNFLESAASRRVVREAVRTAAAMCGAHPATFALSLANELPPDVVRWTGARRFEDFLDELAAVAKEIAPECLCTFGNYPPTEYLRPRQLDFDCSNVYLHRPKSLRNYLARLQMLADTRPLVLGEFGLDSLREGESQQAELLGWSIETAFRRGLAGAFLFSFTDEWWKNGRLVEDWRFGLTTRDRRPKRALARVQAAFGEAPFFPLATTPSVSIVVACHNGEATLRPCLESLQHLRYPDFEVIFVDDGSTDRTSSIAAEFKDFVQLRHEKNLGLSIARNTGIAVARGEVIAFTDADCRVDEDWLYYLVAGLTEGEFAGVGGPNLLPPEDSFIAAAVMASPGGPAHVMLTDTVAEHLPGCNMAFWKWALVEIGGFDPLFRRAGDDVDVCWRLQLSGYRLGFSPAAFVWHHRRPTIRAYLGQQYGYGEAEALLARKHPEYFNPLGGSMWRGRIYAPAHVGVITRRPIIYHGVFGSALFQSLYAEEPSLPLMVLTSLQYHVLVQLPLLVLAIVVPSLFPVWVASLVLPLGVCGAAAAQAELPRRRRRFWSRPLVAWLFALQPIVRGWARYRGRLCQQSPPLSTYESLDSLSRKKQHFAPALRRYWAKAGFDRTELLRRLVCQIEKDGWSSRSDAGWHDFDLEVYGPRVAKLQVTTASQFNWTGEQVLHCRLRSAWTLPARVGWGLLVAALALLFGWRDHLGIWPYLCLLFLPTYWFWVQRRQRNLRRVFAALLDGVAEDLGLLNLDQPTSVSPSPAPTPVTDKPAEAAPSG